ncbi:unnamed protein product [Musa acuminata subsp. malaccensis]|uniref:(wild Malaysian banana) hypothetical protein n=1 Tax=Musa acuminata subsp. malaccensis TaxID=214687 RepID=A0A804LA48_MUSAM|nr:unnamed protein product [Musa acuminata subsp. malaccensis]
MALPGPYSGVSTLAFVGFFFRVLLFFLSLLLFSLIVSLNWSVARASAVTFGLVYGSVKLSYLQAKAKRHKKAEAKGHH